MLDFDIIASEEEMGKMAKEYAKLRLDKSKIIEQTREQNQITNYCETDGSSNYNEFEKTLLKAINRKLTDCVGLIDYVQLDVADKCKFKNILIQSLQNLGAKIDENKVHIARNTEVKSKVMLAKLRGAILDLARLSFNNDKANRVLCPIQAVYCILRDTVG